MNVNSRGHNLDTKFNLHFPEIKHRPGLNTPVGVPSPSDQQKNNPKVLSLGDSDPHWFPHHTRKTSLTRKPVRFWLPNN